MTKQLAIQYASKNIDRVEEFLYNFQTFWLVSFAEFEGETFFMEYFLQKKFYAYFIEKAKNKNCHISTV